MIVAMFIADKFSTHQRLGAIFVPFENRSSQCS